MARRRSQLAGGTLVLLAAAAHGCRSAPATPSCGSARAAAGARSTSTATRDGLRPRCGRGALNPKPSLPRWSAHVETVTASVAPGTLQAAVAGVSNTAACLNSRMFHGKAAAGGSLPC